MSILTRFAPILFVLFWSTGFVGAKFGLPYAEPFWFLTVRFAIAATLLLIIIVLFRHDWLNARQARHSVVSGLLIHATYLGGVFWAIDAGMPAGITAIVLGIQPILTAVLARVFLKERVLGYQWFGFTLGLIGVALVMTSRVEGSFVVPPLAFLASILSLLGITVGTIYQKRFSQGIPLLSGTLVQYGSSAFVLGFLAFLFEDRVIVWSGEFVFALTWLIAVLSFGAVLLLFLLIRQNAASQLGSLFYLVPVATSIEAYFLFGERLGVWAFVGLVLTVLGVALVVTPVKFFQRRNASV